LFALAGAGLFAMGCLQVSPQPPLPPTSLSSWSPMGGFTVNSGATCAGKVTLDSSGRGSVSDACFTSADNVVVCTDTTAVSAVRCSAGTGSLSVNGAAGDTISYARVR
jgi:hypothetical protein